MVLVFVAMPVPMALTLLAMGLYHGLVYLVEARMNRTIRSERVQTTLQKDGDTSERPSGEEKKNV